MTLRRFTVAADRITGDRVVFDRDETRHLSRVLRLGPGDIVVAADGRGTDYTVRIETVDDTARGTVLGIAEGRAESPLAITLLQGIAKGDRMETIVRAATELGAVRIVPVIAERTVVRLDPARWRDRARRWQRIAREASKQCGRAHVPEVDAPRSLAEALATAGGAATLALCFSPESARSLADVLARRPAPGRAVASALVGPEGGLAPAEVDAAERAGFLGVSLGRRILRTDTAAVAILALLQSHLGDLGTEPTGAAEA